VLSKTDENIAAIDSQDYGVDPEAQVEMHVKIE